MQHVEYVLITLVTLISTGILVVALLVLLHVVTKKNWQATRVETGGMKFKVLGESVVKVLDNIPGHFVDQKTHEVKPEGQAGEKRAPRYLESKLGIFWVSWLYPMIRIHNFQIVADKLKEEIPGAEKLPIRERIQTELRDAEGYLRFRFPHPLLIPAIELGKDRWKVDLILVLDIRIVNPVVVVFDYKGKVLRQVDAAVSSAAIDFWNDKEYGYPEFIDADKGPTSPFSKKIMELNNTTSPALRDDGLKTRFGVEIMAAWIEMADLSPEQKPLDDAARGVQQAKLLADAKTEGARGAQVFEAAKRKGIAEGFGSIIQSLKGAQIDVRQAGEILKEEVRTGNIAQAGLTTYIEGNSKIKPVIPASKE